MQKVVQDVMAELKTKIELSETIGNIFYIDKENKEIGAVIMIADEEDIQGDIIKTSNIFRAMTSYMIKDKQILNINHKGINDKIKIVGNYFNDDPQMTYKDISVPVGWIMQLKILDSEIWKKIENKELKGLSWKGKSGVFPLG
jgi:hypothetical protein